MTSPAEVGSEVWIFTRGSPMTMHNLTYTKQLSSLDCISFGDVDGLLPLLPNPNRSGAVSQFSISVSSSYNVEYSCEYVRRLINPTAPSRFGCLYAFPTEADANLARDRYKWGSPLRRFEVIHINGAHRADMETVTSMRGWLESHLASFDQGMIDAIWANYWRGQPAISVELPVWVEGATPPVQRKRFDPPSPIWELLIDGAVRLVE